MHITKIIDGKEVRFWLRYNVLWAEVEYEFSGPIAEEAYNFFGKHYIESDDWDIFRRIFNREDKDLLKIINEAAVELKKDQEFTSIKAAEEFTRTCSQCGWSGGNPSQCPDCELHKRITENAQELWHHACNLADTLRWVLSYLPHSESAEKALKDWEEREKQIKSP